MLQARTRKTLAALIAAAPGLLLLASSCNYVEDVHDFVTGDDDTIDHRFYTHTSHYANAGTTPIVVSGKRVVFLADEASSGKNLNAKNGDGGFDDQIAVLVDMQFHTETVLGAATKEAAILGHDIYLVVNERDDSWDWSGDGTLGDTVLLHYPGKGGSPAAPHCEFVDTIDASSANPMLVVGSRLYYTSDLLTPPAVGETNLKWVDASAPKTPVIVGHNIAAASGTGCLLRILKQDESLLFLTIPELFQQSDMNNDGVIDANVLALLDTTDPAALALSTELAIDPANAPLRARNSGPNDWTVGFLVSEGHQHNFATGLNDPVALGFPPSWNPSNCPAYADTDVTDDVLHFLQFAAWSADPIANPPQNTGLVGTARIVIVPGFIATISPEAADGGCSTNGDGDTNDLVFRWTSLIAPLSPFTDQNQLLAIALTAGNAASVTDLKDKFVIIVDENADSRNHDQDSNTNNFLVAWLDPSLGASAQWVFDHDPKKAGIQAVPANSMEERPKRDVILLGMKETLSAKSLNNPGVDKDLNDSVPAYASFSTSLPTHLVFPYSPVALANLDGGLVKIGSSVFFRANEFSDTKLWFKHKKGATPFGTDVLLRGSIKQHGLQFISPINLLGGAPSIFTDEKYGYAWIADETQTLTDYDHDGDKTDLVVRWKRFAK